MVSADVFQAYYRAVEAGGESVSLAVDWLVSSGSVTKGQLAQLYKVLCEMYGKACAQAALEFYQTMRAGIADEFVPRAYTEVMDKAQVVIDAAEASGDAAKYLRDYASRWTRQQAVNTVTRNAALDPKKPKCMRIAQPTACGYCRMLASLGGWYANAQTARNANLHENCHCSVVVEFSDAPELEGYDYTPYEQQYLAARKQAGTTKRAAVIAQMDKDAGRSHQSAAEQAERAAKRAAKAAKQQN